MADTPWYRNGLRFTCTRCGRCCGGGPGTIRASDDEIAALAAGLGMDDYERRSFPVVPWDLYGEQGHPIRATVASSGRTRGTGRRTTTSVSSIARGASRKPCGAESPT